MTCSTLARAGALPAVAALLLLTACGAPTSGAKGASGEGTLDVGVLIPGSASDQGYMQSAAEGVAAMKEDLAGKVDVSSVEQVSDADYEQALMGFARKADLVVSVGGQTDAAVRAVAAQFPDVKFVEIGGPPETTANLAAYDPAQGQAAYLAGASAALLSTTKKVGFVAGVEIPPIVAAADAFSAGAKAADPSVTVLPPQYTGDFDDVAKAKEAVLADVRAGGDVFYQIENLGLQGMAAAAKETGTHVIGGPLQRECGTDPAFIAYTLSDIGAATRYAVDEAMAGSWKPEKVSFGLDTPRAAASGIEICADAPDVEDAVQKIADGVADGSVTLS